MTRLVLARHGETIWHAENRYAGVSDIGLTTRGREQGEELAEWATSAGLAALVVSPLKRARETAAPVSRATGLAVEVDVRLREIDFGSGEGLTNAEMERQFGGAFREFTRDPAGSPLPGGEDPAAAAQRAVECLRDLAARNKGARVLVVAHNTLLRLALCELLGIPLGRYRIVFPALGNGAVTEIGMEREDTSLLRFNARL